MTTVNIQTYIEVSFPTDQIGPDPNSEDGEALLRIPISEAAALAAKIKAAADEAERERKR